MDKYEMDNDGSFRMTQLSINNILKDSSMNRIVSIRDRLIALNGVIDTLKKCDAEKIEIIKTVAQLEIEYTVSESSIKFCIAEDVIDAVGRESKISTTPSSVMFVVEILQHYRNHVKRVLSGEMENYDARAEIFKNEVINLST